MKVISTITCRRGGGTTQGTTQGTGGTTQGTKGSTQGTGGTTQGTTHRDLAEHVDGLPVAVDHAVALHQEGEGRDLLLDAEGAAHEEAEQPEAHGDAQPVAEQEEDGDEPLPLVLLRLAVHRVVGGQQDHPRVPEVEGPAVVQEDDLVDEGGVQEVERHVEARHHELPGPLPFGEGAAPDHVPLLLVQDGDLLRGSAAQRRVGVE